LEWDGSTSLAALAFSAFVSATVLPGNSEIVLLAVLKAHPQMAAAAIAVATIANTLGGLTTYALGRLVPARHVPSARIASAVRRHGAWALLASWVPFAGDALCAAAGWMRVHWAAAAAAMAAGKLARYVVVGQMAALI
jgi:membrane protein YqaA with SNARE-associated domain